MAWEEIDFGLWSQGCQIIIFLSIYDLRKYESEFSTLFNALVNREPSDPLTKELERWKTCPSHAQNMTKSPHSFQTQIQMIPVRRTNQLRRTYFVARAFSEHQLPMGDSRARAGPAYNHLHGRFNRKPNGEPIREPRNRDSIGWGRSASKYQNGRTQWENEG